MNANALRHDWPGPAEGLTYRMVAPSRAEAVKVARDWVVAVLRSAGCGAEVGALVAATADDWAAVAQGDCVKVVWFGFAVAAAGTG
ncbi:hypothetical protein [Streptomyces lavendulae]|uniref:hypothetical protein n=1 Tax=Streptomyces lavendulae TaxID=1914 RepID=UPI0024A2CDA6|nr:hypothetical protein [Streptomyces lavendulae]GLX18823.1 hypothetical protein Slala01_24670 [Streptomyces lavendulae subsp. lavendulae]GLX29255.1 hypothetical protein Slala02_50750 [Streptomyces lavendulae subsp. lavendulae]